MLETEKWSKAKEIFQTAIELSAAERKSFVKKESGDDELIEAEVLSLLAAHEEASDFIVEPAAEISGFFEKESKSGSLVGSQIGAYKILGEIGRGGMGAVYLAERADSEYEKRVAVKLIKRGLDTDEIVRRFRTERQILANLEHPNIARLLDGGATGDGLPFLVMEYVEGLPLTRFCAERKLDLEARLEIFLEVCAAVSHAHRNLIVHRDLKPPNIIVGDDGTPKLLDFGIAKLLASDADFTTLQTATNVGAMTPEYASPEQVRGETVTTATDVYSLGVLLYELLTDARPYNFTAKSLEKIVHTVCEAEPARPSSEENSTSPQEQRTTDDGRRTKLLKGDLDNIVLMAMRKEPERRYSSVEQFAADIRRYQNGLPVIAGEDNFSYRAGKFVRRNRVGVAAAGGIAVSLIAGIFATARQALITRNQRDKADKTNKFLKKMLASADPRAVGKDAKIVEVLQIAADSIDKDFKDQPEIVADLSATIGLTFLSIGQIDSAETHLREALEIHQYLYGSEHHETAMSLNNFGKLLQAKGDSKSAEKFYRNALLILRRGRGTDALDVAAVLGNLGYLLMLEAEYEESKRVHYESLRILRERLGENHSEYARTLSNLANVFSVTGDKRTAESIHRQALAVTQKFYGDDHPDTALAMLHLAITIMNENVAEAENLFRQTLDLRRRFYGEGHIETAWSLFYLGDVLMKKADYEKAVECADEILSWRGRSIPETHSVINSVLLLLARCYLLTDRPAQAEPLLQECVALRKQTLPSDHWLIATAEGYLAECYMEIGKSRQAAPLLEKSYKTLLEKLGANHEHTILAEKRLKTLNRLK